MLVLRPSRAGTLAPVLALQGGGLQAAGSVVPMTGMADAKARSSATLRLVVAWAVGSMRNRANWQLTSVKQLRNVLRLITAFALERRDVATIDPDGRKGVFTGCTGLVAFKK